MTSASRCYLRQNLHGIVGGLKVFFKAGAHLSMIAERLKVAGGMVLTVLGPISSST